MSNFFKPKDFKDFGEAVEPQPLPDGSYEPVLNDEDLKICSRRMCLMDTVSYSYATQNAPCAMFASYYALRKIYGNDEDAFNTAILNQLDCVFNATPPVSGLLLGAGLAIEDKGHLNGLSAENDLKIGLMGPISGIGDVLIWILPMTILGSIAGYMAQQGSPVGILLWLAFWIVLYFWRCQNYVQGYKAGASVVTKMGDKLNILTDAASILGLTVVGSLIFSAVKISTPLVFQYGEIALEIQKGVLDQIFPNLLAVLLALLVYKLIKKGIKLNWIILGILVVSCACAGLGILAA
ncbi:MAG: PTS system mannose/fructose/sorbose family transporter subunit IID [Coriobacteriaceae bacterium]|nr:PTS system mannose/fructose/sorbose family transporter subunit IID [Coriobacteriaceae bacterium]